MIFIVIEKDKNERECVCERERESVLKECERESVYKREMYV